MSRGPFENYITGQTIEHDLSELLIEAGAESHYSVEANSESKDKKRFFVDESKDMIVFRRGTERLTIQNATSTLNVWEVTRYRSHFWVFDDVANQLLLAFKRRSQRSRKRFEESFENDYAYSFFYRSLAEKFVPRLPGRCFFELSAYYFSSKSGAIIDAPFVVSSPGKLDPPDPGNFATCLVRLKRKGNPDEKLILEWITKNYNESKLPSGEVIEMNRCPQSANLFTAIETNANIGGILNTLGRAIVISSICTDIYSPLLSTSYFSPGNFFDEYVFGAGGMEFPNPGNAGSRRLYLLSFPLGQKEWTHMERIKLSVRARSLILIIKFLQIYPFSLTDIRIEDLTMLKKNRIFPNYRALLFKADGSLRDVKKGSGMFKTSYTYNVLPYVEALRINPDSLYQAKGVDFKAVDSDVLNKILASIQDKFRHKFQFEFNERNAIADKHWNDFNRVVKRVGINLL
jgi:hypothetical protein